MNETEKKEQKNVKDAVEEKNEVSDSDTSKDIAPEQKKSAPPLGALLDDRTGKIRNIVFREMAQSGIPASLMDYILTAILAEVRDLKAKEYSDCLTSKEE